MLFHVVLFRPRPDLASAERADLVEALEGALQRIPSIRRFHIGRRVTHGAGYEALMPVPLDYGAVIEFDDLAGLKAYLEHPAHKALGSRFMQSLESSAIFDYQMQSGEELRQLSQEE
jgi:Stress responsive A/B Barrel Domain